MRLQRATGYALDKEGRVSVHLEDGTSETGDVLVGADGVNSVVRAQLCPAEQNDRFLVETQATSPLLLLLRGPNHARLQYGSLAITLEADRIRELGNKHADALLGMTRQTLLRVLGPGACSWLFMLYQDDADDKREKFTIAFNHNVLAEGEMGADSVDFMRRKAAGNEALSAVVSCVRPEHFLLGGPRRIVTSDASVVRSLDTSAGLGRVVLLGDAAHPMTTHRGNGANSTFVDCVHLLDALEQPLLHEALQRYSRDLCARGAKAVAESLQSTQMLHLDAPWKRGLRDCFMSLVGILLVLWRALRRL